MKKLNRLGLLTGITAMTALSFSLGGCSDDPEPTPPGTSGTNPGVSGSTGSGGGGASAGGNKATGGSGGSSSGGTASGGTASGGTSSGGTASGGTSSGGTSSGGAGGKAAGGAGGAAGGASGGSGGSGGGPVVSAKCMGLCEGADSIGTVCTAQEMSVVSDSLKNPTTCKSRCAKETMAADVDCWIMHTGFAKTADAAGKTQHCGHAAGNSMCGSWPE